MLMQCIYLANCNDNEDNFFKGLISGEEIKVRLEFIPVSVIVLYEMPEYLGPLIDKLTSVNR